MEHCPVRFVAPLIAGAAVILQPRTVRYDVKIKIGGIAGTLAGLVGKQPPDIRVWVLAGMAPAFVKWEGPLYDGGPVWRAELALPAGFPARSSR